MAEVSFPSGSVPFSRVFHRRLTLFTLLIGGAWIMLLSFSLCWVWYQEQQGSFNLARIEAQSCFNKDLIYRLWSTMNGGVYVPVSEHTPPNPYLSHVPNRDVTTPSGLELTLVNPAYMTRQVHQLNEKKFGVRGHITSLKPLRPENAPDEWERRALASFRNQSDEFASVEGLGDQAILRYMRPIPVEPGCLKCHATQGFKEGEIVGGIAVSVLMKPYYTMAASEIRRALIVHALLGAFGIFGLWIARARLVKAFQERDASILSLDESEARLRKAEIVARFGNWQFVMKDGLVKTSEGARLIYGLEKEDWRIPDVQKIPLPEYRALLDEAFKNLVERGSPYDVEFKIKRPNDGEIVDIHSIAEYSPEKDIVFGVIQDISDRKRAEREAHVQREILMKVFDCAPSIMMLVDRDFKVENINRTGASFSGKSKSQLRGSLFGEAINCTVAVEGRGCRKSELCVDCPVLSRVICNFDSAESSYNAEGRMTISKGGEPSSIDMLIATALVKNDNSETVLVTITDISDLRRAEVVTRSLEAQLRQTQKLEAIGTLAGGIAHDFNNILSPILGYSEMAMMELTDNQPLYYDLTQIHDAAERARELVKQILTFSRNSEHRKMPIRISLILREALKLLRASIPATIEVKQNFPPEVESCAVLADPTQIHQVIMNLCTNAAHAMRDRGGILEASLCRVEIDDEFAPRHSGISPGPHLKLSVTDTGHGMTEEIKQKIFEPYFTTKPHGATSHNN